MMFALLGLTSATTFAAASKNFYECGGLAGVDEYRVGINLTSNKAGFFDNDSTSFMKLTETRSLETLPPQTLMTFEGPDASGGETLNLYFNLTKKNVALYWVDKKGNKTEIGKASCVSAKPWSDLN